MLISDLRGVLADRLCWIQCGSPREGVLGLGHVGTSVVLVARDHLFGHRDVFRLHGSAEREVDGTDNIVKARGRA